jgi:hypothetical protein
MGGLFSYESPESKYTLLNLDEIERLMGYTHQALYKPNTAAY